MIPPPLILLVLALAALRTWRLLALDTLPILVRWRDLAVGAKWPEASTIRDGAPYRVDRPLLAEWLTCAWCSGLAWSVGWYAAWLEWPRAAVYAAAPLALSAAVGIASHLLAE